MARRITTRARALQSPEQKIGVLISNITMSLAKQISDVTFSDPVNAGNEKISNTFIAFVADDIIVESKTTYGNSSNQINTTYNQILKTHIADIIGRAGELREALPDLGGALVVEMERGGVTAASSFYKTIWHFHGVDSLEMQGFMPKGIERIVQKLSVLQDLIGPTGEPEREFIVQRQSFNRQKLDDNSVAAMMSPRVAQSTVVQRVMAATPQIAAVKALAKEASIPDLEALARNELSPNSLLGASLRRLQVTTESLSGEELFGFEQEAPEVRPDEDDAPAP